MGTLMEVKLTPTLPQIMMRKRQIPGKREFNAANVFGDFSANTKTVSSAYKDTFSGKSQVPDLPAGLGRKQNKNDTYFLRENTRFINEKICVTASAKDRGNETDWWPKSVTPDKKVIAPYKLDSVTRYDYQKIANPPMRSSRFNCNPQRLKTADGIIPVGTNENFTGFKPTLSYEHQYDCRRGRVDRGKRVGMYVYNQVGSNPVCRINNNNRHTLISLS